MAIKGNLRDFSLSQLLNLINLAQKSGTLVVEGTNDEVEVFFTNGKLAYAQDGEEDNSLVGILYKYRLLSAAQYRGIKANINGMSDKELGLLLINANYFSQQEILTSLQTHFTGVLNKLFSWMEGLFEFNADILPPETKITVKVNLENIILEGSRQHQEWEYLEDEIPSLDIALKFVDRPSASVAHLRLSAEEWKVIPYIHPRNTIAQIGKVTKLNDMQVRQVVYNLLQAGIIEMVRQEQGPVRPPRVQQPEPIPVKDKEEKKSLVLRVIDRIRSL